MNKNIPNRIIKWGQSQEAVRALILEGSRASRGITDELSDYDVNIFFTDPAPFMEDDSWLYDIEDVWLYVPEKITYKNREFATRLIIFRDGVKADFILYSADVLRDFAESLPESYEAGYRVLLDKDDVTQKLPTPTFRAFGKGKPAKDEFRNCIREFWFEAHHVARYLKRNDLWPAKFREWAAKTHLMQMIQWNERAKHNWDYYTHPLGKNMKNWAVDETVEEVSLSFAGYKQEENWKALFAMTSLFGRLGRETADVLKYHYPEDLEENLQKCIHRIYTE